MNPRQLRWLLVVGWSLGVTAMAPVSAQPAQATGPAASAPPTASAPPAASVPTKRCNAMHAKVAREEKLQKATTDAIAKDQRAKETCSSKSMCARYDGSIQSMGKRLTQQQARVARFKDEAARACRAP